MGHNESSPKRKTHSPECLLTKESIHKQSDSTPRSSRTKKSKFTQEESTAGNNQTRLKSTKWKQKELSKESTKPGDDSLRKPIR